MVEQHRRALLSAEKRRDASFRRFADVEAIVQEAGENLKTATSNYNKNAAELDPVLDKTWDAIQELENASATLATDFLFWRSSWEQYEQARHQAQKLQEDFASDQDSQFKSPLG